MTPDRYGEAKEETLLPAIPWPTWQVFSQGGIVKNIPIAGRSRMLNSLYPSRCVKTTFLTGPCQCYTNCEVLQITQGNEYFLHEVTFPFPL